MSTAQMSSSGSQHWQQLRDKQCAWGHIRQQRMPWQATAQVAGTVVVKAAAVLVVETEVVAGWVELGAKVARRVAGCTYRCSTRDVSYGRTRCCNRCRPEARRSSKAAHREIRTHVPPQRERPHDRQKSQKSA